mgnify:CR=1 FL=1
MSIDQERVIENLINKAFDPLHLKQTFFKRLAQGNLTRDEDPASHFCTFLLYLILIINRFFLAITSRVIGGYLMVGT